MLLSHQHSFVRDFTWTLTAEWETSIKTTQRRMLRWMLGAGTKKLETEQAESEDGPEPGEVTEDLDLGLEPWVDWIIRTTGIVEGQLGKLALDDWVTAVRRK